MAKPLRDEPPCVQMRSIRRGLNRMFKRACNKQMRGWAVADAIRGWMIDNEHWLSKRGPLEPVDYERLREK